MASQRSGQNAFSFVRMQSGYRRRIVLTCTLLMVATVFASLSITKPPSASATTAPGGLFTATQGRILDTRPATQVGPYATAMPSSQWRSVQVAGNAGVPLSGVSAVSVVLTAVSPTAGGYLDAAADGTTPSSLQSYLNYATNKVATNTAIIPVGSNGKIQLRASSPTHLVVDVQGYYSAGTPGAGAFVPIVPARFADSRTGSWSTSPTSSIAPARLTAGSTRTLQVGGRFGVPADATGVAVNITIVEPAGAGSFTIFRADATSSPVPYNFTNTFATSFGTIAELSSSGAFTLKMASTSADVVVDVVGYFKPGATGGTYNFARGRVLPATQIEANAMLRVRVGGVGDVPALSASAFDIHVAVISGSAGGFVNLWPGLSTEPATATLNYPASSTVSNNAIVASSSDDHIRIRNHGTQPIQVVLDVEGWFAKPPSNEVPEGSVDPNGASVDGEEDPYDELDDPHAGPQVVLPTYGLGSWQVSTMDNLSSPSREVRYAESAQSGTWWDGQCTDGESKFKVLKNYPRERIHPRMETDTAKMYCGTNVKSPGESKFGLRKIRAKHKDDFGDLAALEGGTWGHFMHWAVWHIIDDPDNVRVQGPIRFCYEKEFFFEGPNGEGFEQWMVVILGETGQRIMTAFPKTEEPIGQPYCPRGEYIK